MAVFIHEVARLTISHADWERSCMEHRTGVSAGQVIHSFVVESLRVWIALDIALLGAAQGLVGGDDNITHCSGARDMGRSKQAESWFGQ